MKCLVRLCPNENDEGQFAGPVCEPCAIALRGEGKLLSPAWYRVIASVLGLEYKVGGSLWLTP